MCNFILHVTAEFGVLDQEDDLGGLPFLVTPFVILDC